MHESIGDGVNKPYQFAFGSKVDPAGTTAMVS